MTNKLPDYAAMEPPEGKPVEEFTTHERRAEILRIVREAGSPFAIKQVRLAERYDVHESTISRDMDRIRESVGDHLGSDAKLTTRVLFEKTVRELQKEGEWKQAWDVAMDWNEWLAEIGEQHREPKRSELDVDVESRHHEVAYTVISGDGEALFSGDSHSNTTGEGDTDLEELGFTSAPSEIDVEPTGEDEQ